MPSKLVRQKNFERNSRIIREFCKKYDMDLVELNDGFQMRIEDMLDLYPVRGRWHNLNTQERGDWHGYEDLRKLMLKMLEVKIPATTEQNLNFVQKNVTPFEPRPFQKEVIEKMKVHPNGLKSIRELRGHNYRYGFDFGEPGGDKSVITKAKIYGDGNIKIMWIDEFSDIPNYKWYRNPIKWYRFRKLWKKIQHKTIDNT